MIMVMSSFDFESGGEHACEWGIIKCDSSISQRYLCRVHGYSSHVDTQPCLLRRGFLFRKNLREKSSQSKA